MEPAAIKALMPVLATLIVFGMPVAIVFVNRYFKLKHRELELEADLQAKWTEESRRQLEARVAQLEGTMGAVLQLVAPRGPANVQAQASQLLAVAEPPPDALAPAALGQRERG
jgi:hypothetical protein